MNTATTDPRFWLHELPQLTRRAGIRSTELDTEGTVAALLYVVRDELADLVRVMPGALSDPAAALSALRLVIRSAMDSTGIDPSTPVNREIHAPRWIAYTLASSLLTDLVHGDLEIPK